MKDQKKTGGAPKQTTETSSKAKGMKQDELKDVDGGFGLLGGSGNDLGNAIGGTLGVSNSSSGTKTGGIGGDRSYSSNDDHRVDFGLGSETESTNF